jgi:hypothetical protein
MLAGLIGLAALVGGLCCLYDAVKRRSALSGLGAIVLLGPFVWYPIWSQVTEVDQWSPCIPREALHGRWRHRRSTLELFADGTFRIDARGAAARRVHLTRAAGRWELGGFDLTLHPRDGSPRRLRVIVSNAAYRIIEAPGDFERWVPWTGFNRFPAAWARDRRRCRD